MLSTGRILRQKYLYVGWCVLHFLLILSFCCSDTLQSVAYGPTILASWVKSLSRNTDQIISFALGRELPASNPVCEAFATYANAAGIEAGYGYFAPNVPASYKLVFELHYADGRVEYELPSVSTAAAGVRIGGLLDYIGRTRSDELREVLVKMLAEFIWRQHPEAKTIRAIFGSVSLPSVREFKHGKRESYEFLYAYDFSLRNEPAKAKNR